MTAIWPAGPPKVCRLIANQARTAVRNGTTVCSRGRTGAGSEATGGDSGAGAGSGVGVGGAVSCGCEASRVMDVLVGRVGQRGWRLSLWARSALRPAHRAGSGRLAAEQQAAAVVLVETVEDWAGDGEGVLVAAAHRQ